MPEPTDPQRAFDPRQLAREMLSYDLRGAEAVRREQVRTQVDADARMAEHLQHQEFRNEVRRQQEGLRRYEIRAQQIRADWQFADTLQQRESGNEVGLRQQEFRNGTGLQQQGPGGYETPAQHIRADWQFADTLQQREFDASVAERVRVNASMARDLSPDQVEQDDRRERFLGAGAAGRTRQSGVVASAVRTLWQFLRRNRKTEKEQGLEGYEEREPLLAQHQSASQERGFGQSEKFAPQESPPGYERFAAYEPYQESLGYEAAPQEFGLPPQVLAEPRLRYEPQPQEFGLPPDLTPEQTPYQRYDALGPDEKKAVENATLDMIGKNPIYKQAYAENRLPTAGGVAGEAQSRQLAEEQQRVSGIAAAARASQTQAGPLQGRPRPSAPGTGIPAPVRTNTQAAPRRMSR